MAMEAHDLLCSYAPQYLRTSSRASWDQDAGAFSQWLADFDEQCSRNGHVTLSRLPLELFSLLEDDSTSRPPLRISGFDRVLPTQRRLFDAWGSWQQLQPEGPSAQASFYSARESQTELESCANWCHQQLSTNPDQRLLIITQDLSERRGEIERAFFRFTHPGTAPLFEFSLGIPLSQVSLARSALLLLRWLSDTVDENALDWLFACGLAATSEEASSLQTCMRTLRRFDQQRLQWPLEGFLNQGRIATAVPQQWKRRMISAQRSLKESAAFQNPIDWADKVPHLLETIGWPATPSQTSVEFQALRRWQQALDTAGSLGFDGRRIAWHEFLAELEHAANDILFAPQSIDAPIQIAGPAESAGLTADALWFLGCRRGLVARKRGQASLPAALCAARSFDAPLLASTGLAVRISHYRAFACLGTRSALQLCAPKRRHGDTPLPSHYPTRRHATAFAIPLDSSTARPAQRDPFRGCHQGGLLFESSPWRVERSLVAIAMPFQGICYRASRCQRLGCRCSRAFRKTARSTPA